MAGYQVSILNPGMEICSPVPLAFSEDWRYQRSSRGMVSSKGMLNLAFSWGRPCSTGP